MPAAVLLLRSVLVALLLVGCSTGSRISSLVLGMSPTEVTGVMGAPDGAQHSGEYMLYEYSNRFVPFEGPGVGNYTATFKNNKLIEYGFAGRSGNSWDRQQLNTVIIR